MEWRVVMFRLRIESHFDASHIIPNHPGKCKNLHGHFYKIEAFVTGNKLDPNGILENSDFINLKDSLREITESFDHRHLNDIIGNNTTAENIAKIIFTQLKDKGINNLEKIRVWESPTQYAEYCE